MGMVFIGVVRRSLSNLLLGTSMRYRGQLVQRSRGGNQGSIKRRALWLEYSKKPSILWRVLYTPIKISDFILNAVDSFFFY